MSNSVNKKGYEHFVPAVKPSESFPKDYNFVLINTVEKLKEVLSVSFSYMGFDTETTGLNPEIDFIVGYSFCFDGKTAYYVPVKHFNNVGLGTVALDLIYEKIMTCKKIFLANARFDIRFMEFAGYDMSKCKYYDVTLALALADTNWKEQGLKWCESHFLGWKADTFTETVGDAANFYYVAPEDGTYYAATDALGTFCLAPISMQYFREGGVSAQIEQMVVYPLMKYEDTLIPIDIKELKAYQEQAVNRLAELEHEIYSIVGYQFRINSNRDKALALSSLGISTGMTTGTGNMAVSIKAFNDLLAKYEKIDEEPPKIIKLLIEHSQLEKLHGSYITSLINNLQANGEKGIRFSYKLARVPTGRLACGTDKGNSYFGNINLQSIPKPHPCNWYYRKAVPESDPRYTVLGWEFSLTPFGLGDEERVVEGKSPKLNLRDAFKADEGQMWCVIDFSAQELRVPANLTLDPSFVRSFTTPGGDPHTQTAIEMFGEENYDKEKRKIAKTFNFGILYGMSTYSVADRYHIPLDTAEKWVDLYKNAHRTVFAWVDQITKKARKEGTVYNYFGRPRRVKYYLESSDPKMRSFGYRTVVNTSIQSVGADMTKLVLIKYYKNVFNNPRFIDPDGHHWAEFRETIHDEVGCVIDKVHAEEVIAACVKSQRLKMPGWPVPMDIGLELGNTWGCMFPFKVNQDTGEVLEPDGEYVNSKEVVEEEKVESEEENYEITFD